MRVSRTVTVSVSPKKAFEYLSDFTTTTEWDPGTVSTVRVSGHGGVGTVYENRSKLAGRESELTYVVTDVRPNESITLRGENPSVVAVDTITFEPAGKGTRVTYTAHFTFKGAAKLAAPFLRPAFKKLGDEAEEGLREHLGKL
jgi:carbon monoxide dehydrogenase subunit G